VEAPDVDWLVRLVLDALARDEAVGPQALRFLLHRYVATGEDGLGEAVGVALARAIGPAPDDRTNDPPAHLTLVVEAASLSDDERLRSAAADLARTLRQRWPSDLPARRSLPGVEACLLCLPLVDLPGLAAAAVDELERVVGLSYRPGAGIGGGTAAAAGGLDDHIVTAHALLTAYRVTGRLPYAMLADDLLQFARRRWWDEDEGAYRGAVTAVDPETAWFVVNCEAARALCRVAYLHADPEYVGAAVVAEGCNHAADAHRVFARLAPVAEAYGLAGAVYGLALDEAGTLL
jgi:hypothetical protein